tara:strand:+ start:702 stop:875 length:174 start_codon:yes stop_codon:yes gene_type:complete
MHSLKRKLREPRGQETQIIPSTKATGSGKPPETPVSQTAIIRGFILIAGWPGNWPFW